ncbi:MAG TPA: hypothetical protein VGK29_06670 [Paludibaculum sp.]
MIPIRPNQLAGLEWRQPSTFSREYELRSGESLLARIVWMKTFGTLASAETAESSWTFKRTGFLTAVVTARDTGGDTDIVTYRPNWTGAKGQLRIGGQELQIRSANFWASRWLVLQDDAPLIEFGAKGLCKAGAELTISEAARGRADLPLLLCFVWYILLLHMEDSAGAVIAAT